MEGNTCFPVKKNISHKFKTHPEKLLFCKANTQMSETKYNVPECERMHYIMSVWIKH